MDRIRSNMALAQSWVVWRVLKHEGIDAQFDEIRALCGRLTPDQVAARFRRKNMLSAVWQKLRSMIFWSRRDRL